MRYLKPYKVFEDVDDFSKFVKDINADIEFDYYEGASVSDLVGKIVADIIINPDKTEMLLIIEGEGEYEIYKFYHDQDCCEHVSLYDVNGDLDDLIDEVILQAEEVSRTAEDNEVSESGNWTFYKFATKKGYVTLRWLGESNGYYSERMDFVKSTTIIDSHEDLIQKLYSKSPYQK